MKNEEKSIINKKFLKIKEEGYVKEVNSGGGIEKTFKSLFYKDNIRVRSNLNFKIKNSLSNDFTILFKYPFENYQGTEVNRIREKYGYIVDEESKYKILKEKVRANCSTFVGGRFLFKLDIDYEAERIYLHIMDKNYMTIEKKLYWTFKTIEEKLKKKFYYVMFLNVWTKEENDINYYKFYDMNLYKLKPIDEIIKLIQDGIINIIIDLDIINDNGFINTIDRGNYFEIEAIDFIKLFEKE